MTELMHCPKRPEQREERRKIRVFYRPAFLDHRHHAVRAEDLRGSCEEEGNRCVASMIPSHKDCRQSWHRNVMAAPCRLAKDSRHWTEVFGATINTMLAQGSRQDSEQVAEPRAGVERLVRTLKVPRSPRESAWLGAPSVPAFRCHAPIKSSHYYFLGAIIRAIEKQNNGGSKRDC
jgi:hypothetical protein